MDAFKVKRILVQTLENYRRCGITRFGKLSADALPIAWRESLDALVEQGQEKLPPAETLTAGSASSPGAPTPLAPGAGQIHAPQVHVPQTESLETGVWKLPVLDEAQRGQRFAQLDVDVKACRQCAKIVSFRQQTVFGVGPLKPTVCFVGEAPGADEDRQGEPFVGRAGQLLNKIIHAMTLKREEVYILNALKCRPPQNRTPLPEEIDNCRHFVASQLEVLQPQYIVCLGAVAVRSILQVTDSIGKLRGRWHAYCGAKVLVTYHPSYLLRNESAKRLVWDDMKMLMRDLNL